MNLIFVVDIDGTICDSMARIDAITKKHNLDNIGLWTKEHVDEFTNAIGIKSDELIDGAEILPQLARACGAKLMFLTGRSSRSREATAAWLKFKLNIFDTVPLIMREDDDMSGPAECKINIFKNTILKMYPDSSFVFFDDDEELLLKYSEFGLALKAPECWKTIRFDKEMK